jgi:hypothetical protein
VADFLAIKNLAGSDLGWFRPLVGRFANTKQKGINLNADVLIEKFYRDLPAVAASQSGRIMVDVTIYGPRGAGPMPGSFKIIRSAGGKNRRLNGTLVNEPLDEPGRFSGLQPNDLAVLAFDGRPAPTDIRLVLLSAHSLEDGTLHSALAPHVSGAGQKTMATIGEAGLRAALDASGVPSSHPLWLLLDGEDAPDLEDASHGGIVGTRRLETRRIGRPVSRVEMRRAVLAAADTGQLGEELVNAHLAKRQDVEPGFRFEWVSDNNAIAPYDFNCGDTKEEFCVDAKATRSDFGGVFHMSFREVIHAAESPIPYLIYRVYELTEDGGKFRASNDIRSFALQLRSQHDASMPGNVTADGFSIPVDTPGLVWSEPVSVVFDDDPENRGASPLPTS